MKRRLLSLALAVSMIFSSVVVRADEVVSEDVSVDVSAVDEVETGSSLSTSSTSVKLNEDSQGPSWSTTSPWLATVYGDAGGQAKITNWNNPDSTEFFHDADGNVVYPYDVQEDGSNVRMRMGIFKSDNITPEDDASYGKIASSSSGITYYYQELTADDDFTLSATAHVNALNCIDDAANQNRNQVGFGLSVRDVVIPLDLTSNDAKKADAINAGPVKMYNAVDGDDTTKMGFAWVMQAAKLTQFDSEKTVAPTPGKDYKLSIKKSGTVYTLTFDGEETTVDAAEYGFKDDLYAGLFVTRAADVTFSNVRLSKAGAAVEVGDWESNGNGFNGQTPDNSTSKANQLDYMISEVNEDNSEIYLSIDPTAVEDGKGKFSTGEDSYYYRAMQIPAGEDFTLTSNMSTMIDINASGTSGSNVNQRGAGIILFDHKYVKNANDAELKAQTGPSVFIGTGLTRMETQPFVIRVNDGAGKIDSETLFETGKALAAYAGPYAVKVKKSGDVLKIKITDTEGNVYEKDLDVTGIFENNQYVGYCVARDGAVKVTDNKVVAGSKKVASFEVASMPTNSTLYSTQKFDPSGMVLDVKYTDGTTGKLSGDDEDDLGEMSFLGFDDATNKSFTDIGERTLKISLGSVSKDITINVRPIKVTNINIAYQPVNTEYLTGALFSDTGISATYTLEDGSVSNLAKANRVYTVDGTELNSDTPFAKAGERTVKLAFGNDPNIDPNGVYGDIPVTVKAATLQGIDIMIKASKTQYCVGESLDTAGLVVQAVYSVDGQTGFNYVVLDPSEYTVTGLDTSKAVASQTLTIVYNRDTTKTCTYDVQVIDVSVLGCEISYYPRLTYQIGEEFDPSGLALQIIYNNGNIEAIDYDGYYMLKGADVVFLDKATGTEEAASLEALEAANYYVDLSDFDTSAAGYSTIHVVTRNYGKFDLTASVVAEKNYYWKAACFGASSLGVKAENEASSLTLTKTDGSQYVNGKEAFEIAPELMVDGKLNDVEKVNVRSWDGSGKVSGDQDGIAYYYTRVDGNKNFQLSADITVNNYVIDPDTADGKAQIAAKQAEVLKTTGESISEIEALDRLRSGQECFGIMARDVIPLAGGVYDGVYKGGITNHMTTDIDSALIDETTGEPMDLYEAWKKGVVLTDAAGDTYRVASGDVENTFASNIVIAGGCTDSTFPTDPTSSSYYRKSIMNRINIMIRTGVIATNGGGTRVGIKSTTTSVPKKGDKYNVTLQKLNSGFLITTYDYQTGTTNTQYDRNDELDSEGVLNIQNPDNIWVGFFASRWADIDVSNITLYENDPSTDKVDVPKTEEEYTPRLQVGSSMFTTTPNYTLYVKANNPSGGLMTVTLNGNVVYKNVLVSKKYGGYLLNLKENSINDVTLAYTPSTVDNCTSYDTVISRYKITQTNLKDLKALYVSPDGGVTGDGSRENPLDLESAIGFADFGTEIIMLDGTYNLRNSEAAAIDISELMSGTAVARKTLRADTETDAHPVIDLESKYAGILCAGNYWNFENFAITKSGPNMKPFHIGANNCIVRGLTSYRNQDTGIQVSRIVSTQYTIDQWPSNNLFIDCEAYDNCDPAMQNADGFASKLTVGYNNVFEDCVSHHNLDDGWDCYTKLSTGPIGPVTLENCISYRNGIELRDDGIESPWASPTASGNGFKVGGENIMVKHYVKDSIAFDNRANGVDSNNNPGFKLRNVICMNNLGSNFALYSGSGEVLADSQGNYREPASLPGGSNRPYKFNYDFKGAVSITGASADQIGSLTDDTIYGNANDTPLLNSTNYFIYEKGKDAVSKYYDENGQAVEDVLTTDKLAEMFLSIDKYNTALDSMNFYSRNADGTFDHGTYLVRTEAYVHDAGDEVILPNIGEETQATTSQSGTEATTERSHSGGGGGGGGGGGSARVATTTTTTEATTAAVVSGGSDADDDTEDTTTSSKTGLRYALNPPKDTGVDVYFDDLEGVAWAEDAINALAKVGVVKGTADRTFSPRFSTKRADLVLTIVRALGLEANVDNDFTDVDDYAYYAHALAVAKAYGIAEGYPDGTFKPEDQITRQDVMVLVSRAYEAMGVELDKDESVLDKFADNEDISGYAREHVAALVNAGVVSGDNLSRINPLNNITRAETAIIVNALYDTAVEVKAEVDAEAAAEAAAAAETEAATEETTETVETESTEETTSEETTAA